MRGTGWRRRSGTPEGPCGTSRRSWARRTRKLGEKDKEIMYLKRREQAMRALNGIHAPRGPDPNHIWTVEKRLDYIIGTPKLLKKTAGCTRGQFAEILKDFERDALARGPLFRGGPPERRRSGKPLQAVPPARAAAGAVPVLHGAHRRRPGDVVRRGPVHRVPGTWTWPPTY